LKSNTDYLISIQAYDSEGNVSQLSNVNIKTNVSPVTNLIISLISNNTTTNSTNLIWTPNLLANVAGFEIYRNGTLLQTIPNSNQTKFQQQISGLNSGTNYIFYVKAFDSEGNKSASSNTITVATLVPAPPPPVVYTGPRNIEVRARNDSPDSSVALTYSKNGGPKTTLGSVINLSCAKHATINAQDGDTIRFFVNAPRKIAGAMSPTCPLVILGRNSSSDGTYTDVLVKNGYIQMALTIE
jgi:hypothetical protein